MSSQFLAANFYSHAITAPYRKAWYSIIQIEYDVGIVNDRTRA